MGQSIQPRKIHGVVVQPIGPKTAVEHTVHHFLEPSEEWHAVPPRIAPSPSDLVAAAGLDASRLPSLSRARSNEAAVPKNLLKWQTDPALSALASRAHAEGYYPRYTLLMEHAGKVPGGKWRPSSNGWVADIEGFRVAVYERHGEVWVTTAMKSAVKGADAERYSSSHQPFRQFVIAYRQAQKGTPSQATGGQP